MRQARGVADGARPVAWRATSSRQARGVTGTTGAFGDRCWTAAPLVAAAAAAASSHGRDT